MSIALDATAGQRLQLLSAELSSGLAAGVVGRVIDLPLGSDLAAVQWSWTRLLETYPGLRVCFQNRSGTIKQLLRSYPELPDTCATVATDGADIVAASRFDPFGAVLVRAFFSPGQLTILVHHALVDEWSLTLIVGFLRRSLTQSQPPVEPEPRTAYLARIQSLHRSEQNSGQESDEFWRRHLESLSTTRLPVWPAREPAPAGRWRKSLDAAQVRALSETARAANVSVPMLAHAAASILLHRYGMAERPAIGVPTTLRDHPSVGFDTVGPYLTVLPVAVGVEPSDSFAAVLARVRDTLTTVHKHKFTPLPHAYDPRQPPGSTAASSIFGVTLAVRAQPAGASIAGLTALPIGQPAAPLQIDLVLADDGGELTLAWRGGAYPWPAADTIGMHLLRLMAAYGTDPGQPVGARGLLTDTEFADLHGDMNQNRPDPAAPELLPYAISRSCEEHPDRPAVADRAGEWTYAELAAAISRIRTALRTRRLPTGARVGVSCGRSRWQMASIVAVWHEGLCYVPLHSGGPAARNRAIIEDARIAAVIGAGKTHDDIAPSIVINIADIAACPPTDSGAVAIGADNPAYVMFTSGSSGRPKGVAVTHGNLASFADALADALPITRPGRWLAETDATFDISLLELVLPLRWGQAVTIADVTDLSTDTAQAGDIAYRQCTPSRARQLLTGRHLGEPFGHMLAQPRLWLLGGEALPETLLRELQASYPRTVFVNMYGPTETTIWSTYHRFPAGHDGAVPIGKPLPNTELVIHDATGHPAAAGVVGELLIGGTAVAAGYLDRPDLDGDRFVTVDTPGGPLRVYQTGDLVQLGPDGLLFFHGRVDGQVKIRGHRVELADIEHHLLAHESVAEAVAYTIRDDEQTTLAAAVTGRPGHRIDIDRLRADLARHLPEALIPGHLAVLPVLPRLPSGKTDRVRTIEHARHADTTGLRTRPEAPAVDDPAAATIAKLATDLLDRTIDANDDFFRAGGNSLTALRLVALLGEHGIRIRPIDVFEHRTPRRIATAVVPPTKAARI